MCYVTSIPVVLGDLGDPDAFHFYEEDGAPDRPSVFANRDECEYPALWDADYQPPQSTDAAVEVDPDSFVRYEEDGADEASLSSKLHARRRLLDEEVSPYDRGD